MLSVSKAEEHILSLFNLASPPQALVSYFMLALGKNKLPRYVDPTCMQFWRDVQKVAQTIYNPLSYALLLGTSSLRILRAVIVTTSLICKAEYNFILVKIPHETNERSEDLDDCTNDENYWNTACPDYVVNVSLDAISNSLVNKFCEEIIRTKEQNGRLKKASSVSHARPSDESQTLTNGESSRHGAAEPNSVLGTSTVSKDGATEGGVFEKCEKADSFNDGDHRC